MTRPEEIFGANPADLEDVWKLWAKRVHPDMAPTAKLKELADEAFKLLTALRTQAEDRISRGVYGSKTPTVLATLRTKTAAYSLHVQSGSDDISDYFEGESDKAAQCVVRAGRDPRNNDLMKTEADVLAALPAKLEPKHAAYFPVLLDSFEVQEGSTKRRANVFVPSVGAVTLEAVRAAYPKGLDVKDAAWMWNRMLEALHLLHGQGFVHGNVTPDRFTIIPDTHVGTLRDFAYAVKAGGKAKAISPKWRTFYPPELTEKKELDFSADLFSAAHCMNFLLGADLGSTRIPAGIPVAVAGLLRACWLGKAHRVKSAQELHADFKEVRKGLGWKSEFRAFSVPTAVSV
jgi:hypothetical protein